MKAFSLFSSIEFWRRIQYFKPHTLLVEILLSGRIASKKFFLSRIIDFLSNYLKDYLAYVLVQKIVSESEKVTVKPKNKLPDQRTLKRRKYLEVHNWLYYDDKKKDYLCKKGETCLFETIQHGGINKLKFVTVALNSLEDHPSRTLRDHENSKNHRNAIIAYNC